MKKIICGKERYVVETDEEKEDLEDARSYFRSIRDLLNRGLDYHIKTKSSLFSLAMSGRYRFSLENWRRIKIYAERSRRGETFYPSTFTTPVLM